jgi:hypothetical protein
MPTHYFIDAKNSLVRTTFSGVLTRPEVLAHAARIGHDPAFHRGFSELVDLTQAETIDLTASDFRELQIVDPFSPDAKRAFLVRGRTHIYGLIRMFQVLRDGTAKIEIFDSLEEALLWLR